MSKEQKLEVCPVSPQPVNYKNLLISYMRHVKAVKSMSFVDHYNDDFELTEDEKTELRAIENYIDIY